MQNNDLWHYPRTELATQILSVFESGLASAFTFFAPRRMGKTEFLRKDIQPLAQAKGWNVFYFSFLDAADHPTTKFKRALEQFINSPGVVAKVKNAVKRVTKMNLGVGKINEGLEFDNKGTIEDDIKELLGRLAKGQKTLLLMDEVQALASNKKNDMFIASFRTALDIYKDNLKVIFTGSSQAGLRKMFSEAKAPFFHFGQNLAFPDLEKGFTDHLCQAFKIVTKRELDQQELWDAFVKMHKVPLLARSLVERMVLNPALDINQAKQELVTEIFGNREFDDKWQNFSALEQSVLKKLACGSQHIFSYETRKVLAAELNLQDISVPMVQGAIKKLIRKGIIAKAEGRTGYSIDDPNFKNWLCRT